MNAIQSFVPPSIVKTFATFLEFLYITRRNIITEDALNQLATALQKFHAARQVFSGTVRPEGPSAFSLPRQHAMVHYFDHIKNFGSPNGLCSSITESKHITAVKRPWRRSNKHMALPQMLKSNERLDKLAAARADFTARGMLDDSCLIQAIKLALVDHEDEDAMDDTESDAEESESETSEIWATDGDFTSNPHVLHRFETSDASYDYSNNNHDDNGGGSDDDDGNRDSDNHDNGSESDDNGGGSGDSDEDDEDECGPVDSGPLMNEVRLVSRKGIYCSSYSS